MNTIVKNIIDCNGIKYLIKKTTKTKIFEDLLFTYNFNLSRKPNF